MKVFFDTNVIVSAFAARGLCADLMRLVLAEHEVVTGEVNIGELRRVLRDRFKATPAQIAAAEDLLRDQTVVPKPTQLPSFKVRDSDDAWVLASALAADVDILVTGDQDLLVLAGHVSLRISSPREAWDILRASV